MNFICAFAFISILLVIEVKCNDPNYKSAFRLLREKKLIENNFQTPKVGKVSSQKETEKNFLEFVKEYRNKLNLHAAELDKIKKTDKPSDKLKTLSMKSRKNPPTSVVKENSNSLNLLAKETNKLRPMSERTIKLRENLLVKDTSSIKKLSFNNGGGSRQTQFYDPTGSFSAAGMGSGVGVGMGSMQGFNQQSALSMGGVNQFMSQNQAQQFVHANPAININGHSSLRSQQNNYFQSNAFTKNPLRKNNDLNKRRQELLSDRDFLRNNPKLGQFLFTKTMNEASSIGEDVGMEQEYQKHAKGFSKFTPKSKKIEQEKDKYFKEKSKEAEKNQNKQNKKYEQQQEEEEEEREDEETDDEQEFDEKIVKTSQKVQTNDAVPLSSKSNVNKPVVKNDAKTKNEAIRMLSAKFGANNEKATNGNVLNLDALEDYLNYVKEDIPNTNRMNNVVKNPVNNQIKNPVNNLKSNMVNNPTNNVAARQFTSPQNPRF